tara:strand:- start:5562 stop:7607 length:2046 start_codon:yes stop_codon:yes gene_type:complete
MVQADNIARNPAQAPHSGGTASGALETIVVSATRTARAQFTTPATITVIDADTIELIQPYGYQNLFESVPAVNVTGGPRRIAEEPAIRGFSDEQVAIRVDGTRFNYNKGHGGRFLLDPGLIQSVEVLRGAGSAIYGSGALGGAFLLETVSGRDLVEERGAAGLRLSSGYQSNGEEWRLGMTAHAGSDSADALAHVARRDVGRDLLDGSGDAILATRDETASGLLKLGLTPADQRLELTLEQFRNDGRNPANANDFASASNLVDRTTERRNTRLRYQLDPADQSWLDLSFAVYENEVDAREFRLDDQRVDETTFRTRGFELLNTATIAGPGGAPMRLTAGIELYEDQQSGTRNGAVRPQFPDARVQYQALFLQGEVPLPAGFSLIPGLRHDAFDYSAEADFPARSDSELTPRLALAWQPRDSLYLWLEYAEAFRAPSLGELFSDGVHFVVPLAPGQVVVNEFLATPDLRAEHSEQLQLGARWRREQLFDRDLALTLEASAWRSEVDDFVDQVVIFIAGAPRFYPTTRTLVFPGVTSNRNVDARMQGAEVSMTLRHALGYLNAGLTLIDGERANGEDLASVQPNRATLGGGIHLLDGQLTLGANLLFSAARRDVPEGALATSGYGKTDVFLRYRPTRGVLAPWELSLAVDNLFDNSYRVHPNAIEQPGRSLRLSVSRNFDWFD